MARTEPPIKVARVSNWHAPKMRAHPQQNEPLLLSTPVAVHLGVAQYSIVILLRLRDLVGRSMLNEHRLPAPLDRRALTERDRVQLDLHAPRGEHVGRRRHCVNQLQHEHARGGRRDELRRAEDHVGERALGWVALHVAVLVVVVVVDVRHRERAGAGADGGGERARVGDGRGRRRGERAHGRGCVKG